MSHTPTKRMGLTWRLSRLSYLIGSSAFRIARNQSSGCQGYKRMVALAAIFR